MEKEGTSENDPNSGRDPIKCGKKYASNYRLHAKEINEEEAKQAINRGRCVVASF